MNRDTALFFSLVSGALLMAANPSPAGILEKFPRYAAGSRRASESQPLAAAPTLTWNTFLGGTHSAGYGIAVDGGGNVYVTGISYTTWGTPILPFAGSNDAFVAKLAPNGTLLWHTFLGGAALDAGYGVAVDAGGNVYVAGMSHGSWGSPLRSFTGVPDGFAAKLAPNGTLLWHTFLGGADSDIARGIAVAADGGAYTTGASSGGWGTPILPMTGKKVAFVARLSPEGALVWNTFPGGYDDEGGFGIAADAAGDVYVTGGGGHPSWGAPILPLKGNKDAFVAKLGPDGSLVWNTFLGGYGDEGGHGIAVDASGGTFVTGWSYGGNGGSWGAPIRPMADPDDAFVAKLDADGVLRWNTFLGGSGADYGHGIAVDSSGSVSVIGYAASAWGVPILPMAGFTDPFVARLDGDGALRWSTFLGGTNYDYGYGIAADPDGNVYATGMSNGPWGAPLSPFPGTNAAFVARFRIGSNTPPVASDQALSTPEDTALPVPLSATDADGDPLAYTIATPPKHGTLRGRAPAVTYTPLPDYSGPDSFSFQANDGRADSNPAVVTITVEQVNDPPVAKALNMATVQNLALDVNLRAADGDGDPLAYAVVVHPEHGSLTGTAPRLRYAPDGDYRGQDRFLFKVSDGQTDSAAATVTIAITPPVALSEALDAGRIWTTGGAMPWVGQVNVRHDGIDAAQSGFLADGQGNWLKATVVGPKTITFWWRTSSDNGDELSFSIDSKRLAARSGVTRWQQRSFQVGRGTHVVTWTFSRDASGSAGMNAGFVDQVRISAPWFK